MVSIHSCPVGRLGTRDTGGMSVYIRELSAEIGRRGHLVDIYTRAHDPEEEEVIVIGDNVRLIHSRIREIEDVPKLVLYAHLDEAACSVEGFRKRDGGQYDLIHSHYWLSGWVGKRISGWWGIPHITMFHTLAAAKNATGVGEEEPDLRVATELDLARDCDLVIAPTEKERIELIRYYDAGPDTISVVPCGVNLSLFRPIDREQARRHLGLNGGNIVLFVGRVDPLKGLDKLLRAIQRLGRPTQPDLVVVGGGEESADELAKLRSQCRELQIQDSVVFAGVVKHEDLPYYYSAADLSVVPSYYESFGLAALESLACGTPVVATRVGGIENVIRDGKNGYTVESNAPDELAAGIASALANGNGSRQTVRDTVAEMSWAAVADRIIDRYRSVLGTSRQPALT
jgi:D-inositol-3-phosphate glycosyltransferase